MMTIDEILAKAKKADVKLVRFLYVDNDGIIRARASGINCLKGDVVSGMGGSIAVPFFGVPDTMSPYTRFGAIGELRTVPDLNTFTVLPYARNSASLMCDMRNYEHEDSGQCARTALKRVLKGSGFDIMSSFENEFYLAVENPDGSISPYDHSRIFTSVGMQNAHDVVLDIIEALEAQSITVEKYYKEYGPGQQEIVCRYADALQACDNQVTFRETARSVAQKHGVAATFMPKPFNGAAGSGVHVHVSLWKDGKNAFYDPSRPNCFSELGTNFVGGILKHVKALCLLTSPTINSYKRLVPGAWAAAYACYGFDNKEAGVRICSSQKGREAETLNIEFKAPDGTCNPYLALLGIIAAGLDGVKNKINPGEPLQIEPGALTDEERKARGIVAYPATMKEAIDAFEASTLYREVLGDLFFEEFIGMKKFSWEQYNSTITDWEIQKYLKAF